MSHSEIQDCMFYEKKLFYEFIKRTLDLFFGIILLILSAPILLILGIIIKLTSKGPVIFKQLRVGKNNELFYIYKFRTMRVDAPSVATKKIQNQYITKIGKFLRSTSLDELPQLFNVIKGDMSFVGYRPLIPEEEKVHKYRNNLEVYYIKPGITGWAQVNGRNLVYDDDKAKYDHYYLMNRSLLFDLKILAITFIKVIKREDIHVGRQGSTQNVANKKKVA